MLKVRLLGQFDVRLGDEPVEIPSRPAQSLLAYLMLNSGTAQRREKLAGLLWPRSTEASARSNLRHALWRLRKVVGTCPTTGREFLHADDFAITCDAETDYWLDTAVLDRKVEDSWTADDLIAVVSPYKGELLPGFYDEWVTLERERLQAVFEHRMGILLERLVEAGRWREVLDWGERWIALGHTPEPAYRALMIAHGGLGDLSSVASVFQRCVEALRQELGVEPAIETQETHAQIVSGQWPFDLSIPPEVGKEAVIVLPPCPYRGLAAFREQDTAFFFGRETFTARLIEAVQQAPLVVIVGPSGSGKSSAVYAGLVPLLRGTLPRLRETLPRLRETSPSLRDEAAGAWLITAFRPGDRPFDALATSLLPLLEPDLSETDRLIESQKLADALGGPVVPLYDVVKPALERNAGAGRLLLILDQFEELYTLCPEAEERQRVLDALLGAVEAAGRRRDAPFRLLLTMRADFMGQALAYRPFADALQEASLMLGPMNRQELRAAIEKPAEMQGVAFEAGLVERVLDDVGQKPGNLPLLEFALMLLWERQASGGMTHAGYEEIGQVEGALARYADQVFDELDAAEQEAARRVFVQLVRPGEGTEDTRRVTTRAELGEADANWGLVQHLADKRLVVTGRDAAGNEMVEVAHEALIQRWRQLRGWMEKDRAFRIWQERQRAALRGWQASHQDEDALLRGVSLAEAEGWLAERGDELSPAEVAFIRAGVALRERRQRQRERRRRRAILALAGGLVVALFLALLAGQQWQRAEDQVDVRTTAQAQEAAQRATAEALADARATAQADAEAAEQEALRKASVGLAAQALAELEGPAPERAVLLALEALEGYPYTGQAESALAEAVEEYMPYTLLLWEPRWLEWLNAAWSPDGEQVAALGDNWWEALAFWNVDATRLINIVNIFAGSPQPDRCQPLDLAWSPQGDRLVVSSQTPSTGVASCPAPQVFDRSGRTRAELAAHAGNVNGVDWSPDGSAILTASDDGTVKIWDVVEKGATDRTVERLTLKGHSGPVRDAVWSPTGERVATASLDGTARVWDADSGNELLTLSAHVGGLNSVTWSPNGERLATAGEDGAARVWSLQEGTGSAGVEVSGEVLLVLAGHGGEVRDVDWAPDGARIATISDHGTARVWDAASGAELIKLHGAGGHPEYIAWSPSGDRLITEGGREAIRVWDLSGGAVRLPDHGNIIYDAQWSPDGSRLATTCLDGATRIWDAVSGELLLTLDHLAGLFRMAWSPDGKRIITVQETGVLWVWDVVNGESLFEISDGDTRYFQPAWSPDGSRIVAAAADTPGPRNPGAVVFDALTGEAITNVREARCFPRAPSWSPDGERFVAGCTAPYQDLNTPATIWDAATGERLLDLPSQDGQSESTQWSPDGTRIAVCYTTGPCKVWEAVTGKVLATFSAHTAECTDVAWSPDGARVASADESGTVKVWDAATGVEVLGFTSPGGAWRVKWSPDGSHVIVAGYFNTPMVRRVWQSTEALIAYAKQCCVARELTDEERQQFGLPER